MTKAVAVPWKAWHGDEACVLTFPDSWQVESYAMQNAPSMSEADVRDVLANPIGTASLSTLAQGKKRVAIAVDDLSRPTPTKKLLPLVLETLHRAGVSKAQTTVVVALGSHARMSDRELTIKLGEDIVRHYRVVQHDPFRHLSPLGIELGGVPVQINTDFFQADLKLSMGGITPHPFAGFSGGGKLILPGLANMDIIERTHRYVVMGFRGGLGAVEGNQFRDEIERICRLCGVDFIIDSVVNQSREIAGVFAGDVKAAFLQGVTFARQVYQTHMPRDLDVAILNAYPKDTDLVQSENAYNLLRSVPDPVIKEDGQVVLLTAATHGVGTHGLFAPGGRLYHKPLRKRWLCRRRLLVYSPGSSVEDVRSLYWKGYPFCHTWEDVIKGLQQSFPYGTCRVGVFPCSAIQLGA